MPDASVMHLLTVCSAAQPLMQQLDIDRLTRDACFYLFGERPDPVDHLLDARVTFVGEMHELTLQHYDNKDV